MEKKFEVKVWIRYAEGGIEMHRFETKAEDRNHAISHIKILANDFFGHYAVSEVILQYCKEIK